MIVSLTMAAGCCGVGIDWGAISKQGEEVGTQVSQQLFSMTYSWIE